MKIAVVFNGLSSIEAEETRKNVVRIPEVFAKLRQAQAIIEGSDETEIDLTQYVNSDNSLFGGDLQLKTLVASVVQIGLYDRYFKLFGCPDYLVGQISGYSALRVAAGQLSFESFVLQSLGYQNLKRGPLSVVSEETFLAGVPRSEYGVFEKLPEIQSLFGLNTTRQAKAFESSSAFASTPVTTSKSLDDVMMTLVEELRIEKLISVGPGALQLNQDQIDWSLRELQILESIDLDPLLTWFWRRVPGN